MKSANTNVIVISEINNVGITTNSISNKFNINSGCAGLAFKKKTVIFEPFAQSSSIISEQELDSKILGVVVQNVIAVPIFEVNGDAIGVLEAINSNKSAFMPDNKLLLEKFTKYVSLLFYTNSLMLVISKYKS